MNLNDKNVTLTKKNGESDIMPEYSSFGKFDINKVKLEFGNIQTDEVILMEERERHIIERHPNDYESFKKYAKGCIEEPDIIIKDTKHDGTVFVIKKVPESNLNVLIRLALDSDKIGYKNSIITSYRLNNQKNNEINC